MNKKEYSECLSSPEWQKMRLRILERDGFKCKECGSSNGNLHVHHKYYNGNKPWEYPEEALITLCESCHNKVHRIEVADDELKGKPQKYVKFYLMLKHILKDIRDGIVTENKIMLSRYSIKYHTSLISREDLRNLLLHDSVSYEYAVELRDKLSVKDMQRANERAISRCGGDVDIIDEATCIKFLKKKGYKIQKPRTIYEEC